MKRYLEIEEEAIGQIIEKLDSLSQEIKSSKQAIGIGWLNNEQFCEALKISKRSAQNYRDQKLIPFSSTGGKVYYRVEDVEAFLSANYTGAKNKK